MESTKELNLNEMEKVSGGCIFYHRIEWICGVGITNSSVPHQYDMYRCKDCGQEWYKKDGKEIQPSEWYKETCMYP